MQQREKETKSRPKIEKNNSPPTLLSDRLKIWSLFSTTYLVSTVIKTTESFVSDRFEIDTKRGSAQERIVIATLGFLYVKDFLLSFVLARKEKQLAIWNE